MNDTPKSPMQDLWQQQPVEGTRMSLDEIRKRATKFEKKIIRRNIFEYVGLVISAAMFVRFFVQVHDNLFRIACALMIAGAAYMAYQLHRRASVRTMPADLGAANSLQFHRAELERQREFLNHIWRWYLAPLVPGLATFSLISVLAARAHPLPAVFVNLFFAFCLILTWRLNAHAAKCLQRRIDELGAAEAE